MSQRELAERHPHEIVKLGTLLEKIDTDNPTDDDRRAVGDFLNEYPYIWRYIGDLMEQAMLHLMRCSKGSAVMDEAMRAAIEHMPRELVQSGDGPLEGLLIQNVVMCWLRLTQVERKYTVAASLEEVQVSEVTYWEKRLNAAQRRYLRAVETLARVRKLTSPALQINIGEQQVNQVVSQQGRE